MDRGSEGRGSTVTRVALFQGVGRATSIEEHPIPALGEDEVLVAVRCCTLCGSDLHSFEGRRPCPTPSILGHEILGEVVSFRGTPRLGDAELGVLAPGQRITWTLTASCGRCAACDRGLPQKCERVFKYGHEEFTPGASPSGGLASHCVLRSGTTVFRVPEGLADALATPANCATATIAAALRAAGPVDGRRCAVLGAGMLGLTACAMLEVEGAESVIAVDPDERRRELSLRFGAERASDPAAVPEGVDLVLETSGAVSSVAAGLSSLRAGGRMILIGSVFPGDAISLHPEDLVRRHLSLHGVHNYSPDDLARALRFLSAHGARFPFAGLVGGDHPLDQVDQAFAAAQTRAYPRVSVRPGRLSDPR